MNIKQVILLTLMSIAYFNLIAQNDFKITGKIADEKTGLPIEAANVYSNTTNEGTVTNNEGIFIFKLNHVISSDSLIISNVGYKSMRLSIKNITNKPNELFKLIPISYVLKEVSIKPLPEAKEIINLAKENLDKNYIQNPFLADCYFSEFIKEDGNYVRAMELALQQYNKGPFPNPIIPIPFQQIKIVQKRKSANHTVLADSPLNHCFSLNYLLVTGNLRNYLSIKNYKFTLDSIAILGNESVYIITGVNETEHVTYYITQEGFKVIQLKFKWNQIMPKYRLGDSYFSIHRTEGKLVFKETDKILYPFYTSNILEINYYQNKSDTAIWHKQVISSELLYNNIITENVKEIAKNERLQLLNYPNIYELTIPYDERFWDKYNYPVESMNRKLIYDSIKSKD